MSLDYRKNARNARFFMAIELNLRHHFTADLK